MQSCLEAALRYAAYGWYVFPTHGISERDGVRLCTCGRSPCDAAGKHPRTISGVKDATRDEATIRRWWQMWPDANVAVACGELSGIFVIDIDPRHGGYGSLDEWETVREDGPLPRTLTSQTGGGGMHKFFLMPPDVAVPGRNPWIAGVDIKSNGGYVLAPPSTHLSGVGYDWVYGGNPAEAPADLIADIGGKAGSSNGKSPLPRPEDILAGVGEGQRDDTLFRYACRLRRQGLSREEASVLILQAANACTPPFSNTDAVKKLDQAYQPKYLESDEARSSLRHFTDAGNALRLVDYFGDRIRFVSAWGWVTWEGGRWSIDDSLTVQHLTAQIPELMRDREATREGLGDDEKDDIYAWAQRSESVGRIDATLKLARSDPRVVRKVEDFDRDPWLLNTPDGVVDLRTGAMRAATKDDMLTRVTACEPSDTADCPEWLGFLEKVQPSADMRAYLQRAVGYTLTGSTQEKAMFVLWGMGSNGKTVFLEALRWVLGDYASAVPKSVYVGRREGGHPTDLASLAGVHMATCAEEIEKKDKVNSGIIKTITGGDAMSARFMRQDFFEFTPRCKLWLGTNYQPVLTDFGDALKQRLHLIPWLVQIPREQQIPRDVLLANLRAEGPGILRWALDGLNDWRENGLRPPVEMELAREEWYEEQDEFAEWLQEVNLQDTRTTGTWSSNADLFQSYRMWWMMKGDDPKYALGPVWFAREMRQRGYLRRTWRNKRGFMVHVPNVQCEQLFGEEKVQ